jgi:hypothetical protein
MPGHALYCEADERQADQRRRVVAFDALEERNAERLGANAAGAVIRALASQVHVDLGGGEEPEGASHVDERCLALPRRGIQQAEPGVKDDRLAG